MRRASSARFLVAVVLSIAVAAVIVRAQAAPDLSGTWIIDRTRTEQAVLPRVGTASAAFSAGGTAERLVIRHTPTELSVTAGSAMPFVYKLDGTDTWYPSLEAKAALDGARLVITWTRKNVYLGPGKGYTTYTGKDIYTRDSDVLTVDRSTTTPQGVQAGKVVYTRMP